MDFIEILENVSVQFGVTQETILLVGLGAGVLLLLAGLVSARAGRNPAADRIAASSEDKRRARMDKALLVNPAGEARGVMKALLPTDKKNRSAIELKLHQAGYSGPGILRRYIMIRIAFALLLPLVFILLSVAARIPEITLPLSLGEQLSKLGMVQSYVVLTVLLSVGYLLPAKVVDDKIAARHRRIEQSFPNALDLMRIASESGMGFDASMTRVGNELAEVSPDIAYELLTMQRQVAAGRPRADAMRALGERTGVDTVKSFASVVLQSMQFGSSISQALTTYAEEMREVRETRAQEMANKLPVKMSAVLGAFMLPALILLTLGPTVIRYVSMGS